MEDEITVKKYRSKKEALILDLIKKYPLYSVDKLKEEFPEISRHAIQRILEKNNLSTVGKRMVFAEEKNEKPFERFPRKTLSKLLEKKDLFFNKFGDFFELISARQKLSWSWLAILGILMIVSWWAGSFVFAKPPEISLEKPEVGFTNEGEKLFVSGKIFPINSQVNVNGSRVSLNGDGSFTAIVNIPLSESELEVEAVNKGKKAKVLRLVNRVATKEELQTQAEEEEKRKLEAADKMAELERNVNDLLAAKNATSETKGFLKIINNRVQEKLGFASVVGEVVNLGQQAVSWVMITASFLDQDSREIDRKSGFATDFGEVIKPGETVSFETQSTTKKFDHYSLAISWEEGAAAGIATEAAEKITPTEEPKE